MCHLTLSCLTWSLNSQSDDYSRHTVICRAGDDTGSAVRAGGGYLGELLERDRADVQALGVLTYEFLCGEEPFAADTSSGPRCTC